MKILFITNLFNPPSDSGSAVSSSLIYKELKQRGHEVDLLIFDNESREEKYRKTSFSNNYTKNDFSSVLNELSKLKDGEYDIIHQYGGGLAKYILPYLTRNFEETKVVTTFNGIFPLCWNHWNYNKRGEKCCNFPKNLRCAMEKRKLSLKGFSLLEYFVRKLQYYSSKKYDKYFALSGGVKTLLSQSGYDSSDIKVIPNFYDPTLREKLENFQKKEVNDELIILYLGRIKVFKGVEDLLKATKKIKNENIEIRIVGFGTQKEKLEKEYSHDSRIKFLGRVTQQSDEFLRNLKEADIFVNTGIISARFWIPDAFGRTFLEAALAHNAIIAAYTGKEPESLQDKLLFYESGDIDELTKKLRELINNPEKRKELADAIHGYITTEFNVEKSIDKMEKEYEELLED